MSTTELTSKIRELKELKQMADELAAEITAIEDIIKAEMTARNTDEMIVDVFKSAGLRSHQAALILLLLKRRCPTWQPSLQRPLNQEDSPSHEKSSLHKHRPKHNVKSL